MHGRPTKLLLATALAALCAACRPEGGILGADVLPPEDLIGTGYTDTLSVDLRTRVIDSVRTDNAAFLLFGRHFDPAFGTLNLEAYTRLGLSATDIRFDRKGPVRFDSLVLAVNLAGAQGRFDSPMRMGVYELADSLPSTGPLRSTRTTPVQGPELSGGHWVDFRETVLRNFTLRLRNAEALGNRLLLADSSYYLNERAFAAFFPGLCLRVDELPFWSREPGAVLFLDPNGSQLQLYYSVKDSAGNWQPADNPYRFEIRNDLPHYHRIARSAAESTLLAQHLALPQPEYHFVQAGARIHSHLRLPTLAGMGQVGVNRALLTLHVDPDWLGPSTGGVRRYNPPKLELYRADSAGNFDLDDEGQPVLVTNAEFNTSRNAYEFELTVETQRILNGQLQSQGYVAAAADSGHSIRRTVLHSPHSPEAALRPRLQLYFTRLPK